MKKANLFKKISGFAAVTALMCTMLISLSVLAKGKVSVIADKDKINNGDEVSVTIKAEGDGDQAVAPEISVTYDPNRLLFNDCSVEYGGGSGGLITIKDTNANVSFTSLSGGTAEVDVSATFDGDGTNTAAASAYIEVEGEDTAGSVTNTSAGSMVEAGIIETDDSSKVVSTVFADEFMPVGFHKDTTTYEEQMVDCAKFDMGDITLLYVMDADGSNGGFSIYDKNTSELSDFLQIMGIENKFIIALKADESVTIPANVTKATLEWNSEELEAYAFNSDVTSYQNVSMSDFFLLYAVSSEGNKGFYMYDKADGTYQRYIGFAEGQNANTAGVAGSEAESFASGNDTSGHSFIQPVNNSSNDSKGSKLLSIQIMGFDGKIVVIAVLGTIVIILLIILTISAVNRDRDDYYYYGDGEPEDDAYYEENKHSNSMPEEIDISDEIASDSDESDAEAETIEEKLNLESDAEEEIEPENNIEINEADEIPLSKKEQKALEKARKKEEKRIKKEYGENGPVDWSEFQDIVKGDDDRRPTSKSYDELPDYMKEDIENKEEDSATEDAKLEEQSSDSEIDKKKSKTRDIEGEYEFPTEPKKNPMEMMRRIPANDNNARVQPKPVQQVELDEDFEFEFLKFDED